MCERNMPINLMYHHHNFPVYMIDTERVIDSISWLKAIVAFYTSSSYYYYYYFHLFSTLITIQSYHLLCFFAYCVKFTFNDVLYLCVGKCERVRAFHRFYLISSLLSNEMDFFHFILSVLFKGIVDCFELTHTNC